MTVAVVVVITVVVLWCSWVILLWDWQMYLLSRRFRRMLVEALRHRRR